MTLFMDYAFVEGDLDMNNSKVGHDAWTVIVWGRGGGGGGEEEGKDVIMRSDGMTTFN